MKQRLRSKKFAWGVLLLCVLLSFLLACRYGAVKISAADISSALAGAFNGEGTLTLDQRIFLDIRLPRAVMCILTGGSLAVGGVLLQGYFRNPLLDPGLIGTSGGAAFGASLCLVLGAGAPLPVGAWTLPLSAFAGAILATILVMSLSSSGDGNRNSVVTLLLVGIAINALFMSGVGFMSYIARDPQARSITFWNLGTFSGAEWRSAGILCLVILCCLIPALRLGKQLDTLMLGEQEAIYLGVNIRSLKWQVLILNTLMVSVATSFVGVISFVGLIVPHVLRMIFGSGNRVLIPASFFGGALILTLSDLAARILLKPAELPIGIVTAVLGVPVFIILIRSNRYFQ
jgi:iron complex transport system permease protein